MSDFDPLYKDLRSKQFEGWGGASYQRRLKGCEEAIDDLVSSNKIPMPPARVLELGCGNAMAAFLMAKRGYETYGIDISAEAVDWAQERFRLFGLAGAFTCGDVREMPCFEDGFLDIVMDGACLHCLIGDDRRQGLPEIRRILSEDGTFVVSTMCGPPRSEAAIKAYDSQIECLVENGRPYRSLKPLDAIMEELRKAGFVVMDYSVRENPWWDHATIVCSNDGQQIQS
jgi:ubiquinone/menaquinone biosynthesis C-methylase UbiE